MIERDTGNERLVLSAIIQQGYNTFYNVDAILNENNFSLKVNKLLFSVIKKLVTEQNVESFDLSTLCKTFEAEFGSDDYNHLKVSQYVDALQHDYPLEPENVELFAKKIAKQSYVEQLIQKLNSTANSLKSFNGDETITDIIAKAEKPIVDFTSSLMSSEDYDQIGEDVMDYIEYLGSNEGKSIGIPTGFPEWDNAIGSGLRTGIHVVGARAKVGKSFLAANIAHHVTNDDVPVLYLDTELNKGMVQERLLSLISQVDLQDVSNGSFFTNDYSKSRVIEAGKMIQTKNYSYQNVSGMHYKHWLSIIRKWILRDVGFTNGQVNPCLVIVDYIKLTDTGDLKNIQEYQYLGQLMTDFHNLCLKYDIPALTFVQLNRDGINQDGQGVIAGSDRIIGLCSSFSILRKKTEADYADDPKQNGNRKLIPIDSRYGPCLDETDYINIYGNLSKALMKEGPRKHYVLENAEGLEAFENEHINDEETNPTPFT